MCQKTDNETRIYEIEVCAMILVDETIFDEFARLARYNLEAFREKIERYAENALGIGPESKHPFWDDCEKWLEENRDLFDDILDLAA